MLMNFLKFALHSNSLFVQLVNWGDSVECIHSVATAGAFEHDSLSVAFEKRNWHSVSHGICTSARSGPMTTKSNLKNGEIANGKHCIHWELLNSPFQSTHPASKSFPGLSKQESSQGLTWLSFGTPKIGVVRHYPMDCFSMALCCTSSWIGPKRPYGHLAEARKNCPKWAKKLSLKTSEHSHCPYVHQIARIL